MRQIGDDFYAKTQQRMFRSPRIDINELDMARTPADHVWPPANPDFTRASDPLPSTSYLKRPTLIYYETCSDSSDFGRHILTEVEACEVLRKHPHPNSGTPFSISFLQMIKSGIRHVHKSRLIHNNGNPSNFIMDGDGPVTIDSDSCVRQGNKLGFKAGTDGWTLRAKDYAR